MKRLLVILILLLLAAASLPAGAALPPNVLQWSALHPLPTGAHLRAITYGGGLYVAVGDAGAIITSPDGKAWTPRQAPFDIDLKTVAYGNGLYLAGRPDWLLASTDGITWTDRSMGLPTTPDATGRLFTRGFVQVIFSGGRFLGLTQVGRIYGSADGFTWTLAAEVPAELREIPAYGLAAGDGWFAVAGFPQYSIVYGGGRLVSVGGLQAEYSEPGGDRTQVETYARLEAIAYGQGRFVAVGETTATSVDGEVWARERPAGLVESLHAVTFGGGQFVAVGHGGQIYTSPDGQAWTGVSRVLPLTSLAYGNCRYVAAGPGDQLLISVDGMTWQNAGVKLPARAGGLAYGAGRFVLVTFMGEVLLSPDGLTWQAVKQELPFGVERVWYLHDRFLATDRSGRVSTSLDGITWSTERVSYYPLLAATYGSGHYLLAGEGSNLFLSPDAKTWRSVKLDPEVRILSLTFGMGLFMAGTEKAGIGTSADGERWSFTDPRAEIPTGLPYPYAPVGTVHAVGFGAGRFVAVNTKGESFVMDPNQGWTFGKTSLQTSAREMTYASGRFFLLQEPGSILATEPLEETGPCLPTEAPDIAPHAPAAAEAPCSLQERFTWLLGAALGLRHLPSACRP